MASLDDAREDYADENPPVFLLLGLVSALQRLEPLLPPVEAPCASTEAPGSSTPEATSGAARFLYLVLGLIAFRRHLLATLAAATPDTPRDASTGTPLLGVRPAAAPDGSQKPTPRPPSLRELLR